MLAVVALDTGIDAVMHASGVYPPLGQPMAATLFQRTMAYRTVDGIAGSYIAARFAPRRPMPHTLILGRLGHRREHHRRRADVEQGASLRASLVSRRAHRDGDPLRLGAANSGSCN